MILFQPLTLVVLCVFGLQMGYRQVDTAGQVTGEEQMGRGPTTATGQELPRTL